MIIIIKMNTLINNVLFFNPLTPNVHVIVLSLSQVINRTLNGCVGIWILPSCAESISSRVSEMNEWEILSALEDKICIPVRPCNILYILVTFPLDLVLILLLDNWWWLLLRPEGLIIFYYIDKSVLLEKISLVKFIKTTSGTQVVYFP